MNMLILSCVALWKRIAVALMISMLSTSPVQAGIFLITFSGTVTSASDSAQVFGPADTLVGKTFSAAYTLNYPSPGGTTNETSFFRSYFGGAQYGTAAPLNALLTINGRAQAFGGSYSSSFTKVNDDPDSHIDEISVGLQDIIFLDGYLVIGTTTLGTSFQSETQDFLSSLDFDEEIDVDLAPGGRGLGRFFYAVENEFGSRYATGDLAVTHVKVEVIEPLPEPATWAMMIVGVGLVGIAMRRRRTIGLKRCV